MSEYELLQPWSSFILKTKLPKKILKSMIKLTDEIVNNPESKSLGNELAGQIAWEPEIDVELIKKTDIEKYFYGIIHQYCMRAHLQSYPFEYNTIPALTMFSIDTLWIISKKDNEYNPLHHHTNCNLSSVMYLKIPEFLPARKQKHDEDGNIVFYHSPMHSGDVFGNFGNLTIKPKVGDFFVFPALQMHQVYPFRTADGKGERRSVSFNASCGRDKEKYKEWAEKQSWENEQVEKNKNLTTQPFKKIRKY